MFTAEDKPSFTSSQAMPNSYFSRSKDGAYVPLKLTDTCQDWVSDCDAITPLALNQELTTPNTAFVTISPSWDATTTYPFVDLHALTVSTPGHSMAGDRTSCFLNDNWAHICARNLAVTTSYSFFIRLGLEMQVSPNSSLAPQLKLSPPHDALALDTYFAVARELKDAYPADYNSLGKIWDVISAAMKLVSPALTALPVYGPAASVALNGVVGLGDVIRGRRQKRRQRGDKPPLAAVERAREQQVLNRASAPPLGRRKKRKNRNQKRRSRAVVGGTAATLDPRPGMQVVRL